MRLTIGIDDHDSPAGGCTTHFTTLFIKMLNKEPGIRIIDLPYLIRLNPNIPWKTRGNAALSLIIEVNDNKDVKDLLEFTWNFSLEYVSTVSKGFQYHRKPGVVIINERQKESLRWFYKYAMEDIIPITVLEDIIGKYEILNKGDRGRIGALAAATFDDNITFELLTYRKKENWGLTRNINLRKLQEIDEKFFPKVFANIDYIKRDPLIISHGKDPVLYGLRGIDPNVLNYIFYNYHKELTNEEVDCYMIFKSNQATDAHITYSGKGYPYQTIDKIFTVIEKEILKGGDVKIVTEDGSIIYFFKETGELNYASKLLQKGDRIRIVGTIKPSVKNTVIIEAEKMKVIELSKKVITKNPKCPKCNGSTESLGKNKGFRCKVCGYRFNASKVIEEVPRELSLGLYQSRQYRHLTKPIFITPVRNQFIFTELLNKLMHNLENSCSISLS